MANKHFLGGRIILGTEFVGYKFKFFEPGTSTPKTTYKDSALTVGNENTATVTLDANGAAQIWFDGNADVVFYTSADVVVYSDDDINVSTTASTSGTGNLIINGSFETDSDADGIPDSWTRTLYTSGTFSLQTTDQFNGQKSIKFTSTGTGGGYITSTDTFAVSPSVSYTVGWAMKGTADVRNVVEILWYQDDGSASGVTSSTTVYDDSTTNPTSWTEKWYEVTSPSDAAFAAIRLTGCHSSDATSGNTAYDSVVFTDLVHKRSSNTFTGAFINSISLESTDAGATVAPNLDLYRNSASPAASDILGTVNFYGEDSAGNKQLYGRAYCFLEDPTSTGEAGRIRIEAIQGGLARLSAEFKDGQVLGSPTGSFKGDGTLNAASGIYDNGVRINPSGTAKAWVRFNGTGTIATVATFNLDGATPLTDNNVGDYSINFDTDFASTTSYLGLGNAGTTGTPSAGNAFVATVGTYATGAARVLTHDNNTDAVTDADNISFVFWGTQ